MSEISEKLFSGIEEQGWKGRTVSIDHLPEIKRAVRGRYEEGLLDRTLFREQLSDFEFEPPANLPAARSILIVAAPVPQTRVYFNWKGTRFPLVIPPTYAGYLKTTASIVAALDSWLVPGGFRAVVARLPLKTVAVGSGLADYGRNNLCYVAGMGSMLQLVGAFSDLPCDTDFWQEPKMLERCADCVACLRNCPTGAIPRDRFLLHAETCLTYHNESARNIPEWIDPESHHCLIGCMRCQNICPEDRDVRSWFDDRFEFTERETECFLEGVPSDQWPKEAAAKLESLSVNEDLRVLRRNLSLVLSFRGTAAAK